MRMRALPVDLSLAAALREARRVVNLPQHVVAVRAAVSPAPLQRAERYGVVSTRTLTALCRVYSVTVDQLRQRHAHLTDSVGRAGWSNP